ncbi:MAG: hypothetical protein BGN88_00980 [Clostridiales bacterium 43-6]|nr:MAG: hypothetical protein BGN88_00980 [Clostridiales bacterium 43-6]
MAITKIKPVKNMKQNLKQLIDYVINIDKTANKDYEDLKDLLEYTEHDVKTEMRLYVSGINCEPENAYDKMRQTYKLNDKPMPYAAFHAIQSFAEGEVTAKIAHEIGKKLAEEIWGERFQVIVTTHLNTNHYHNHFAICSTSFIDGKRYHDNKKSKLLIRQVSDRLCREYQLSVIEHPKSSSTINYAQWRDQKNGRPMLPLQIKADVDEAIMQSRSEMQFHMYLEKLGYKITLRGREEDPLFSITPQGYAHAWRLSRHFGDDYTYNRIMKRVEEHSVQPPIEEPKYRPVRLKGGVQDIMKVTTLHGLYICTLYQIGFLPKNYPKRVPQELREELLKLDNIIAETRLLGRNHIDTVEQLFDFRNNAQSGVKQLEEERQKLRNRLRRNTNQSEISEIKAQITSVSSQLAKLRKEIRLCDGIAERSGILVQKLNKINARENLKRKEFVKDESFGRRG